MRLGRTVSRGCGVKQIDMIVLVVNGFLMVLGLVVAAMPNAMVLGSSGPTLVMSQDIPTRTCRYSRAYAMLQVVCANLGLVDVPSTLKTDIQVLDLSVNRIRGLTNKSLASYTSLIYLDLSDNFIQKIEESAFNNQHYLEVLDLSKNGCDDLPSSLFQLPYLRTVLVSDNSLTDHVFLGQEVVSPVQTLQLSNNRLCRVPRLGHVPSLTRLNLSYNNIAVVSPEDLAPFCSLKYLNLTGNPLKFNATACDCHAFNNWMNVRGIQAVPAFNCTQELQYGCSSKMEFSNRTAELYNRCSEILRLQVETEKARNTWILVVSIISAFLVCLFVGLFCVHKRNKRRKKKLKEEQRIHSNNANRELLNSNRSQPENT